MTKLTKFCEMVKLVDLVMQKFYEKSGKGENSYPSERLFLTILSANLLLDQSVIHFAILLMKTLQSDNNLCNTLITIRIAQIIVLFRIVVHEDNTQSIILKHVIEELTGEHKDITIVVVAEQLKIIVFRAIYMRFARYIFCNILFKIDKRRRVQEADVS